MHSLSEPILAFGSFKLLPLRKALYEGDRPFPIGSRALDILTLLVERSGELVSKEALFTYAWPTTHVEEANLRVHIGALRKMLRDGQDGMRYIVTQPGRGYSFVAPVMRINGQGAPTAKPSASEPRHNLPIRLTRMIGRDDVVSSITEQLGSFRFVTIVGPGGIGKTTVASAIARNLLTRYDHGVHFVDLAPLADAQLVPAAVAFVLGLSIASDNPLPNLTSYLKDKSMLLLLDNCEHVIDSAAALAEALLRAAPNVHVLATSRESMRAEGEQIHRLATMKVPTATVGITAANALSFPSIELFVERATASSDKFGLSDDNAADIADLCRRLDGLPLAIELAAARINAFGVRTLANRLDDRLLLFGEGRRTAAPRHQTLHATLDWSYSLLTADEQAVLRTISVYRAAFSEQSAFAVAATTGLDDDLIMDCLVSLSEKSLLRIDSSGPSVSCRLLDSTRAYAFGKLRESGGLPEVSRRHAERLMALLTRAESGWDQMNGAEWLAIYGQMIDDLRAALQWSLSPEGNAQFATALTAAAVPLWMHLSLTNECSESVARVMERVGMSAPVSPEDTDQRMKLLNALGLSLLYTKGPGPQIEDALSQARILAECLNDVEYQLRALWGLFVAAFNQGNYTISLQRAEIFRSVAKGSANPSDLRAGDRILGFALHLLGHQCEARSYIEGMLQSYVVPKRRSDFVRFQYDQRVAARVPLSAILWLQGFADQAMDHATRAVEEAQSINHAISLGYALSTSACSIALFVGDLATADRFAAMLADHSAAYRLGPWSAWGRYFKNVLIAMRGQEEQGLQGIAAALDELRTTGFVLRFTSFMARYAELLGEAGRVKEGLAVIDEALARCRRDEEGWCLAELLRIKGELLLGDATPGAQDAAEKLFQTALEDARLHGTLAWELRTSTSLAKLRRQQNRGAEGHALLATVYARFTEGFESQDLVEARKLLQILHEAEQI